MRVAVEAGGGVQRPAALAGDMPDTPAVADREAHGVARFESTIHIEVDRFSEADRLQALHDGLMRVLGDVRAAVEDWNPMQAAAQAAIDALAARAAQPSTGDVERAEIAETQAFLSWMLERHFTFLGYRDYELITQD
ncbi:NAD-glutamate dehydrogenase domain-containing protein, partial [Escherichia coli]|uniref:NAD-glutamate dehydrogenase domain-containing protein n=3 Tax=Pseudomonadota TaxID=1224 RepID=UPI00207C337D